MKGYRGFAIACVFWPVVAVAQAPVIDGSSGYRGSQSAPIPQQTGAGLSMEGQLMQQLDQLQQEVSMLRGLLEEQGHKLKQMEQDQLDRYEDLDRRLSSGTGAPAGTEDGRDSSSASDSAIDALATVQPPAAAQSGGTAPPDPEREKLLYEAAFDLVKARDFEKAITAFTAFLRRYPDSEYAGNAQYWLGEVYLAESDLDSAGRSFAQVVSRYSGHRKEADALYKLADVERRLGNRAKALELYQQVLSRHPGSSAAQLARRDMDNLS